MKYVIYKESIDDYGRGRVYKFKLLSNARKKFKEIFGNDFEKGSGYYISYDGVVKASISVEPYDKVNSLKAEELITERKEDRKGTI